ncbi:MAG: YezD family protein [Rariglobus sp.]
MSNTGQPKSISVSADDINSPAWLEIVRQKVESLRYGVVQIVVHDSRVTQIERTEKTRIAGQRDGAE